MTELDPNGKTPNSPGSKLDAGKAPVRRGVMEYFPRALVAVATVSGFGAEKYTWGGWRSVPDGVNRYGDALTRHLLEKGVDEQSGLLHAAHAAWNALAVLELILAPKPFIFDPLELQTSCPLSMLPVDEDDRG